ncbi:hypothetical protein Taro_020072 [Colocasia esculenta]|uniref:Protein kinase domain-containing protein n=1 Tax=Colocasia esculenta TaxID=4460 RepID=A0A843V466_COLES|nr:hypothetical protein [Colocasia esculenta]
MSVFDVILKIFTNTSSIEFDNLFSQANMPKNADVLIAVQIKYLARWGKVCSCLLTFLVILALTVVSIWPPIITMTGTFGRVLECWDREKREHVAIKVVRSVRKYRRAAMIEIDVLNILARNDKGRSGCVQIRSWFDYRNHICIVSTASNFPDCLFYFDELAAIPLNVLRVPYWSLCFQDLDFGNFLNEFLDMIQRNLQEMHSRYLPKSSAIKLIDFGSTAFEDQDRSSIVSTRQYRAPEIILGCILVELCTGEQLFQTHENLEHLAMMERVLGPLPDHMIQKASSSASKYFKRGVRLNWPEGAESRESIRAVRKLDRLKVIVFRSVQHSGASLADLLYGLLTFKPSERLTAREALDHPFFKGPG